MGRGWPLGKLCFLTREEKLCISKQPNNVYLWYKHPLKTKSFDLSIFCSERRDAIFYVTIAMEIFSFVTIFTCRKRLCFRARPHLVFHCCLYKKIFYHNYITPKFISSPLRCLVMHFGFGCDFGCGLSRTPRESHETNASKQSFLSQRKSTPKF